MGTRLNTAEARWRMKTAFANPAAIADNQIVAAPGVGFKIVVFGYQVWTNADTAQTGTFKSGAAAIYPNQVFGADTGAKSDYDCTPGDIPLFECVENQALNYALTAATAVGVAVQYCIERI